MFVLLRSRPHRTCTCPVQRCCHRRVRKRRLLPLTCATLGLAALTWALLPFAFSVPTGLEEDPLPSPQVLDRQGIVLDQFPRPDHFRHQPVEFQEVPRALLDATLAAEDKRFFKHDGMDLFATARATRDWVRKRRVVSGASTITQQLVKISSPPARRNLSTKFREALTARRVEALWSKEQILTAYFNRLDYGNHRQGCREAAWFYFGKPLTDLSLAECALLAGLPQSPSLHNPRRNPKSALKRRNWILDRMAQVFDYDPRLISLAKTEPLQLHHLTETKVAPHLSAQLQRGNGPRTIATTLDARTQASINAIVREELSRLSVSNAQHAAVVVIDNASGDVLALVGSGDFDDPDGGQIDGTIAPRSPGSALKPFTYLLAFERKGRSPGSLVADIPTPYRTEEGLDLPTNFDHVHYGPVTMRHALANSLNVSALRTLNDLGGPAPLHQFLSNLGLSTLDQPAAEYGLGLTIGNAEVKLLELTNAYATLARLGTHLPIRLYHEETTLAAPAKLATPEATYLIAHILSDNAARSAAFGSRSALRLPFRCAVKTGTSSDFRDNWCLGYTADLTVGVWVGNFDNTPMRGVSGVSGAGPIFQRTMLALHEERVPRWMPQPSGLTRITIDARTGHRFLSQAPAGKPYVKHELCLAKQRPLPVQEGDYDQQGRALLDARFHDWYHSPDNTRSDHFALSQELPIDLAPKIISPMATATYLLDPELPSGGRLLKLLSNLPTGAKWSSQTLQIEGDTAHLEPGRHEITLTDPRSGKAISHKIRVESL